MLTDEEMAARVARKQELLKQQSARKASDAQMIFNGDYQKGNRALDSNIRSDFNPDAGEALRSRSFVDNAKNSLAKQEELRTRNKAQKRDDLCEMLGRGC